MARERTGGHGSARAHAMAKRATIGGALGNSVCVGGAAGVHSGCSSAHVGHTSVARWPPIHTGRSPRTHARPPRRAPPRATPGECDFLQQLLADDPDDRPTAEAARQHAWLSNAAGPPLAGSGADAAAGAEAIERLSPLQEAVHALPRLLREVEALGIGAPAAYAAAHSAAALKLVLVDDVARANSDARVPWPPVLD